MGTGLKDYVPETHELKLKSTTITLRGLTIPDVSRLITFYLADIEAIYEKYVEVKAQVFTRKASEAFFLRAVADFPEMIAEVISIASDEGGDDESHAGALRLPAGVQVEALHQIVRLTFEEAGGIKNLFASLVLTLRNALPPEVQARLAVMVPILTTDKEPTSKGSIGG